MCFRKDLRPTKKYKREEADFPSCIFEVLTFHDLSENALNPTHLQHFQIRPEMMKIDNFLSLTKIYQKTINQKKF